MFRIVDDTVLLPIRILRWHVAFWRMPHRRRWHHMLAPGPYKHVSAFGYSARCNVWVFYNPAGNGERIEVCANDATFLDLLDSIKERADLVTLTLGAPRPHPAWRPGVYCVPQIVRLLGVRSSALTPRGLYRDLVRAGARQPEL